MFKKIKIFLFGFGSAFVTFLLVMFCGKKLHDNGSEDTGIKDACSGIQGTAEGLRTTTERFASANRRLETIIKEIESERN